jgi:hypothetical protein
MGSYLLKMFSISLLLTWIIELPVGWCLGLRGKKNLVLMLLVNVLTNPAAVLACWLGAPQLPVELLVVAVEAGIYVWFSRDPAWKIPRPVLQGVAANAVSWITGIVIQWIGGFL